MEIIKNLPEKINISEIPDNPKEKIKYKLETK
jgi:hypothetical protein